MAYRGLDFEQPIIELEHRIEEMRTYANKRNVDLTDEVLRFEEKLEQLKRDIFGRLTPWQKVQIARHPQRPYSLDYIGGAMTDFYELRGDRHFRDDPAIVGGFARIDGQRVMVIGHQKGRDTNENLHRSFGSPHPEGYRKAMRLMDMAARFGVPIVTFIDTPGAYPGLEAEQRGQAEAIAYNLREMSQLPVPIVVVVIGEGGSGGALGIGVGDRVCMLENSYYSVISPEGCAAILWRNRQNAPQAAEALKITAVDLLTMGVIDEIIPEPLGGAHRDAAHTIESVKRALVKNIAELRKLAPSALLEKRYEKFRKQGVFNE